MTDPIDCPPAGATYDVNPEPEEEHPCTECEGWGTLARGPWDVTCHECDGTGSAA